MKKSVLFLIATLLILTVAVPIMIAAGAPSGSLTLATETNPTTETTPTAAPSATVAPSPTGAVISTGTPAPSASASASPSASASASPSPSSHKHKYGDWKVTKEATCEEPGEKTRKCSCGKKQTEELPALGHDLGEWEVLYEATAYNPGLEERACQREGCEYVEDNELPMLEDASTPVPAETPAPTVEAATGTSLETVASGTDAGEPAFPVWTVVLCGVAALAALGAVAWSVLMIVKNNGGGGGRPSGGGNKPQGSYYYKR